MVQITSFTKFNEFISVEVGKNLFVIFTLFYELKDDIKGIWNQIFLQGLAIAIIYHVVEVVGAHKFHSIFICLDAKIPFLWTIF